VVCDRTGRQLHRTTPGQHGPTAAAALTAERHRPYDDTEAAAFTARQRHLLRALPQYRLELGQITALARPLLPGRQQRLAPARTGARAQLLPAAAFG
jgi:hypothetical protein